MVRRFLLLTALLLPLSIFESCVTDSDTSSVFAGMSRDRLKVRLGEPHRVEHTPAGGEDWYYTFSGPLDVQSSACHDDQSRSDSVSVTISDSTSPQEYPIHLSPEGYVIEPLPPGHFVR
jgi:outer membrane protein assembly factor BamE (lipoprotein component of BamABCDE complex)